MNCVPGRTGPPPGTTAFFSSDTRPLVTSGAGIAGVAAPPSMVSASVGETRSTEPGDGGVAGAAGAVAGTLLVTASPDSGAGSAGTVGGPSATKHLLFSAELIDAERALRVGLVDEVHDPDRLADRVDELARTLAMRRSLLTQMASKQIVDQIVASGHVDHETELRWQRALAASADPAEGIAAFIERRDPAFTWTPPPTTV